MFSGDESELRGTRWQRERFFFVDLETSTLQPTTLEEPPPSRWATGDRSAVDKMDLKKVYAVHTQPRESYKRM